MRHNVTLRVLDRATGKLVREQKGHNAATDTMMLGIGYYLSGAGVLRQGYSMLERFIPKYISLGTMGLENQDEDADHLPTGINFDTFLQQRPGYGSDGYKQLYNNNRPYFGLGPPFSSFSPTSSYVKNEITYYSGKAYKATQNMIVDPENGVYNYFNTDLWAEAATSEQPTCYELISTNHPRAEITFRDVVPEKEAELPKSIDVIFSAMITAGALDEYKAFYGHDYIFITEAGLWSEKAYYPDNVGHNGLLAGYRVAPPNEENWDMSNPENRKILQQQVLRVDRDQVVQVIWKIQIGNYEDIAEAKA